MILCISEMFLYDLYIIIQLLISVLEKKIVTREIVITGRSRISVPEHLPSSLEPALSYACPGDVS